MKQKLETLKQSFQEELDLAPSVLSHFQGKPKYIVFLSARDVQEQATVVHAVANSFEAGWRNAVNVLRKSLALKKIDVTFLKADVVTSIQAYEAQEFLTILQERKLEKLHEGIAFDPMFNIAFLADEVNEHSFIEGLDHESPRFAMDRLNAYRQNNQAARYALKEEHIQNVYTFETKSFYIDDATGQLVEVENEAQSAKDEHDMLINELYAIPSLKRYVMPLHEVESQKEMLHYIEKYPAVTIQQEGTILQTVFKQDEEHYICIEGEDIYSVPVERLMESLPPFTPSMYVQQYVQSITELGLQHKLIVRLVKEEQQWQYRENFVVMNVEGGVSFNTKGAIATMETEPFMERNYEEQAYSTLTAVEEFIEIIIRYLNNRPNLNAEQLDVMIGIDVEGTPWIERVLE